MQNATNIKILAFDLGKTSAMAYYDGKEITKTTEKAIKGYHEFQEWIKTTLSLCPPNVILIPYPTRFYNVIMFQSKLMGIIEALADKADITVIEVQDATCKKIAIGSGKVTKNQIREYYHDKGEYKSIDSEHIFDAIMFIDYYLKSTL